MARSSRTITPKRQAAEFKRRVKFLQSHGLLRKKVDLRKSPTPALKRKIKEFDNLFTGKATALKVSKKQARIYKRSFKTVGDTVIVPKAKGERFSVDKDTGLITSKRRVGSRQIRKIIKPGLPEKPEDGKRYYYRVPLGRGYRRFESHAELEKFMYKYEHRKPTKRGKYREPYSDWQNYVELEQITAAPRKRVNPTRRAALKRAGIK